MSIMPNCPRTGCSNLANVSPLYGVLPCGTCQELDSTGKIAHRKFEFASVSKLHRIQGARDDHGKDTLQPYDGNKPNPDFFKAYPDRVKEYGVAGELAKI